MGYDQAQKVFAEESIHMGENFHVILLLGFDTSSKVLHFLSHFSTSCKQVSFFLIIYKFSSKKSSRKIG